MLMTPESFATLLDTFAYHIASIATMEAPGTVGFALGFETSPGKWVSTSIEMAIVSKDIAHGTPDDVDFKFDPNRTQTVDVWDFVWSRGKDDKWVCHGNRSGGRKAYAAHMADVIRQAALAASEPSC